MGKVFGLSLTIYPYSAILQCARESSTVGRRRARVTLT